MAKSPALVPVKAMLLIVTVTALLLVRVTALGPPACPTVTLAHVIDEGDAVTCATASTP